MAGDERSEESPGRPDREAGEQAAPSEARTGVVVVGASAGGLEPLETVLAALPKEFPWPILVVQHGDPRHASRLHEILQRRTKIVVKEAAAGVALKPGVAYVGPSHLEFTLTALGRIAMQPLKADRSFRIDQLFRSAATAFGERVVAVVLSGTGGDGANGALSVKRIGGCVVAQSEASAQHFGMPSAAIHLGAVDFVRPSDEIGPLLERIVSGEQKAPSPEDGSHLSAILDVVRERRGTTFEAYRPPTMHRRIRKRMLAAGFESVEDYRHHLEANPDEVDELFDVLLINVTEFFRDADAWESLKSSVIPELVAKRRAGEDVRVWCAGCSTGEEPYSVAMLLAEALDDPADWARIKIFATDIDEHELAVARTGRYDAVRLANVSQERLERFFEPVGEKHEVSKAIRRMVVFGIHDLTKDPPIGRIDLLVCRNVLIYFGEPLQRRVGSLFHYALREHGYLFLGRSEALPRGAPYEHIDRRNRVLQRLGGAPPPAAGARTAERAATGGVPRIEDAEGAPGMMRAAMDRAHLAVCVVDTRQRVVYANRYLKMLSGATSPEGLTIEAAFPGFADASVLTALESVLSSERRRRLEPMRVATAARAAILEIVMEPVSEPSGFEGAVIFGHDVTAREETRATLKERSAALQETVEKLQHANDDLQGANEELVTANEELQSTNEELATLNEELQSTNEELETTNEELGSTNEELEAVNQELERRTADVEELSGMFKWFVSVTSDAVVVCDEREEVVVWNDQAARVFGQSATETVGRNVFSLDLRIDSAALRRTMREAAASPDSVTMRDLAVPTVEEPDRHVTITVQARRDDRGALRGWGFTARDTTRAHLGEEARDIARALYRALLKGTPEAVLVVSRDGRVADATARAKEFLGVAEGEAPDGHLWEYAAEPKDALALEGAVAELARGGRGPRHGGNGSIEVAFRGGRRVRLQFINVDSQSVPPLILLSDVDADASG